MRVAVPTPRDVLSVLDRAGDAVEHLLTAAPRLMGLLDAADRVLGDVQALLDRIEGTRANADALVARIETPVDRLVALLDQVEPPLTALQPTLERLADTTDQHEIDALVTLVDHLPTLVDQLERDIMPILGTLGSVAPDLHDLLQVSQELNDMLAKVPGLGRIKRRVDAQQSADADDAADAT